MTTIHCDLDKEIDKLREIFNYYFICMHIVWHIK
jgi:hypothetical protein